MKLLVLDEVESRHCGRWAYIIHIRAQGYERKR
jgi:hypothetical protein